MRLAELYRIIYYGPDDNLRGILLTMDTENGAQFLFNNMEYTDEAIEVGTHYDTAELYEEADKQLDASSKPSIRFGEEIIFGLARASIEACPDFELEYYLFGVMYGGMGFHYPNSDDTLYVPLHTLIEGDGGTRRLVVLYAVFGNAVEANVKVKLTRVNSAFDFNGIITARTSAIKDPEYFSVLFFKKRDEKIRLEPEEEIVLLLSRRFVAVPLGSQLILQFEMCIDGNEKVNTLTFVAKKEATSSKILYSLQQRCDRSRSELEVGEKLQETLGY